MMKINSLVGYFLLIVAMVMFNACSSSNDPNEEIPTPPIDEEEGTLPSTFKNSFNSMAEFLAWAEDNPDKLETMEDLEVKGEVSVDEWEEFLDKINPSHSESLFKKLKMASFPDATSVGDGAFWSCTNLISLHFPMVEYIGDDAFANCTSLISVSFPKAEYINSWAFYKCSSLTSISFPKAEGIGERAFLGCENLTSVSFPNVNWIGRSAFSYCLDLISLHFPMVEYIGDEAFSGCTNLTTVLFGNEFSKEWNGNFSFYNCNTKQITLHLTNPKEYAKANGKVWCDLTWKEILNY